MSLLRIMCNVLQSNRCITNEVLAAIDVCWYLSTLVFDMPHSLPTAYPCGITSYYELHVLMKSSKQTVETTI